MGHSLETCIEQVFIDVPDSGMPQFHSLERFFDRVEPVVKKAGPRSAQSKARHGSSNRFA